MSMGLNSITAHIDENSVATRVKQLRSEHKRTSRQPIAIVIVEGDVIDPLIYQGLFDTSHCQIVSAFGKQNALRSIAILTKEGFSGAIAIVDDDFDTLNGSKIQAENVVSTDTHDIENLIINSPALDKYLLYLMPQDKHKFHVQFTKETRQVVVSLSIPLGDLRWHFSRQQIKIDFSEINFRNFIDAKGRTINIRIVIREVLTKNKDCPLKEEEIHAHIQEKLKADKNHWWLVCQGHDLVKVLCILLPTLLAAYAPKDKAEQKKFFESIQEMIETENKIIKHLAMCYEKSEFEKTVMYSRIAQWENKNAPFSLMRQ